MRGTASVTAWSVACRRAAHQILDDPTIFEDPLALRITGGEHRDEPVRLRAFIAARSRYAEDQLSRSGVRQMVVLGAGLDTFAYRNPVPGLQVFEVDHPATQEWKRELLRRAGIPVPPSVIYVAVDFERENLAQRLRDSGLRNVPTFFSWLGVVPYLTREAFDSTIRFIASMPFGSGVVFDYAVPATMLTAADRAALDALAARVARAGEPFQLFFDPKQLESFLSAAGLSQIDSLGPKDIDARYFADRSDDLRVGSGAGRLLSAFSISD